MQCGDTPLQKAVRNGHQKTVEYFIKQAKMDITQFDMVCNIDTYFVFEYVYSIVVGGVACYIIVSISVVLLEDMHVLILVDITLTLGT